MNYLFIVLINHRFECESIESLTCLGFLLSRLPPHEKLRHWLAPSYQSQGDSRKHILSYACSHRTRRSTTNTIFLGVDAVLPSNNDMAVTSSNHDRPHPPRRPYHLHQLHSFATTVVNMSARQPEIEQKGTYHPPHCIHDPNSPSNSQSRQRKPMVYPRVPR